MMMMTRFNVLAVIALVALLGGPQLLAAQEFPVAPTPQPSGGLISDLIHHTVVRPIKSTYHSIKNFFNENKSDIKEAFDSIREKAFESFMRMYNKSYSGDELKRRLELYSKRLTMIQDWNKQYQEGKVSFSLKANQFSDMTDDEMEHINGLVQPHDFPVVDSDDDDEDDDDDHDNEIDTSHFDLDNYNNTNNETDNKYLMASSINFNTYYRAFPSPPYGGRSSSIPESKDWRASGCLSKVKNQGQCGACFAFATVDAVTASKCIHWKEPAVELSPQQIVDCGVGPGMNACQGGWPAVVLEWLQKRDIATERSYPYQMRKMTCRYNELERQRVLLRTGKSNPTPKFLELHSDGEFKYHLANTGPIITAMHASDKFQLFERGLFDDRTCGNQIWNHAVLLVGYGRERGQDYWLVRNSYGTDWGESGYMKMKAGQCQVGKMGWVILKS